MLNSKTAISKRSLVSLKVMETAHMSYLSSGLQG